MEGLTIFLYLIKLHSPSYSQTTTTTRAETTMFIKFFIIL